VSQLVVQSVSSSRASGIRSLHLNSTGNVIPFQGIRRLPLPISPLMPPRSEPPTPDEPCRSWLQPLPFLMPPCKKSGDDALNGSRNFLQPHSTHTTSKDRAIGSKIWTAESRFYPDADAMALLKRAASRSIPSEGPSGLAPGVIDDSHPPSVASRWRSPSERSIHAPVSSVGGYLLLAFTGDPKAVRAGCQCDSIKGVP
jgi:hypothetical protein